MNIDIVYDSPLYNAYIDVSEADALIAMFALKFGSDFGWSELLSTEENAQKQDMIIMASRSLNMRLHGTKDVEILTTLQFPRTGLKYPCGGDVPEIMPGELVKRAPHEVREYVALWIMQSLSNVGAYSKATLKSKTVDGVTEVYSTSQYDFTQVALEPLKNIPSNWLVNSSVDSFAGVGSIGSIRSL